jgi:predicted DNA-binding transcriptional regulator AlpA
MQQTMEKLMTLKEVSELLGWSRWTLLRWRELGEGPKWKRIGNGQVMYYPDSVRSFLTGREA